MPERSHRDDENDSERDKREDIPNCSPQRLQTKHDIRTQNVMCITLLLMYAQIALIDSCFAGYWHVTPVRDIWYRYPRWIAHLHRWTTAALIQWGKTLYNREETVATYLMEPDSNIQPPLHRIYIAYTFNPRDINMAAWSRRGLGLREQQ